MQDQDQPDLYRMVQASKGYTERLGLLKEKRKEKRRKAKAGLPAAQITFLPFTYLLDEQGQAGLLF